MCVYFEMVEVSFKKKKLPAIILNKIKMFLIF